MSTTASAAGVAKFGKWQRTTVAVRGFHWRGTQRLRTSALRIAERSLPQPDRQNLPLMIWRRSSRRPHQQTRAAAQANQDPLVRRAHREKFGGGEGK
jgi:hypothetical protein